MEAKQQSEEQGRLERLLRCPVHPILFSFFLITFLFLASLLRGRKQLPPQDRMDWRIRQKQDKGQAAEAFASLSFGQRDQIVGAGERER